MGLLGSFPTSGWLVARAANVRTLLEPALASVLALVITLVALGFAAPFAVIFGLAISPDRVGALVRGRVGRRRVKNCKVGNRFKRDPTSGCPAPSPDRRILPLQVKKAARSQCRGKLRAEGPALQILKSALFWRILLSSLLVVAVLGVGLSRANNAHEELEKQFERLVQHDLKLADDAEQLLRLMVDLETGKRGYLLTGDRSFLAPYEQARRELEGLLAEAQDVAENGMEDERVAAFGRLLHDWILNVSEPQIHAREKGTMTDPAVADEGKSRTDEMRGILSDLRRHALDDAD